METSLNDHNQGHTSERIRDILQFNVVKSETSFGNQNFRIILKIKMLNHSEIVHLVFVCCILLGSLEGQQICWANYYLKVNSVPLVHLG